MFVFGSPEMFQANFVMSTLPPPDLSQLNGGTDIFETTEKQKKQNKKSTSRNHSDSINFSLGDVIDLDANDNVHVPPTVTATITTPVVPSQFNLLAAAPTTHNEIDRLEEANRFQTRLSTTVSSQLNNLPNSASLSQHNRPSINSQNPQSTNTNQGHATESDGTCVTFRANTDLTVNKNNENENIEEIEVIPQSPQPVKRRRFKVLPRLYENTLLPTGNVVHENTNDEIFE